MGKGLVEFGKVKIKNRDSVQSFIHLFNPSYIPLSNYVNAWPTPISFSLHKKELLFDRFDFLLADCFHLCLWGKVFVDKQKLDMTLGLPQDSLEKFLCIENLSSNYVLQVPLKGTLEHPKLDTKLATAKIAAILTLETNLKKSPIGKLTKEVLKQDENAPPAKRPFPWDY